MLQQWYKYIKISGLWPETFQSNSLRIVVLIIFTDVWSTRLGLDFIATQFMAHLGIFIEVEMIKNPIYPESPVVLRLHQSRMLPYNHTGTMPCAHLTARKIFWHYRIVRVPTWHRNTHQAPWRLDLSLRDCSCKFCSYRIGTQYSNSVIWIWHWLNIVMELLEPITRFRDYCLQNSQSLMHWRFTD